MDCGRAGCGNRVERAGRCGPWPKYCSVWCQRVVASERRRARQPAKVARPCAYCDEMLPLQAPPYRRYCSALCGERARHATPRRSAVRRCPNCQTELPENAGLQQKWCSKSCKDAASRARGDRAAAKREYAAAWRAANREASAAYAREYRQAHRDAVLILNRAAYREDPTAWKQGNHRRRARLAAADNRVVTATDWRRLVDRYDGSCAYCGTRGLPLTVDHVVPIARGGRHSVGNIAPACLPCNQSKGPKLLSEWRLSRGEGSRALAAVGAL